MASPGILIGILLVTLALNAHAQMNLIANFDIHSKAGASELFPSRLGAPGVHDEINLIDIYAGASNSTLNWKDYKNIAHQLNVDSTFDMNNLKKLKSQNYVFGKLDVPLWNALFTIMPKKKYPLTIQLGMRYKAEFNATISKNLGSFLTDGNKQWAGQTVNLGTMQANLILLLQDYVGFSVPISLKINEKKKITLVPAVRINYNKSMANVSTQNSDINMYTEPDGRYIQFTYNYRVNTALPGVASQQIYKAFGYNRKAGADSANYGSYIASRGKGIGADFGLGVQYGEHWTVDFSLTDLGSVTYTKDVNTFSKGGVYKYSGYVTNFDYFGHYTNTSVPNKADISPDTTHNNYSTPMGGKMGVMLNYHTQKVLDDDDRVAFYRHNIYVIFMQGFRTSYNSVNAPLLAGGYTYSLKKILSAGVVVSGGGYYPQAAGAFMSLKLGTYTLCFGSDNLNLLFAPANAYSVDAYLRMGFIF